MEQNGNERPQQLARLDGKDEGLGAFLLALGFAFADEARIDACHEVGKQDQDEGGDNGEVIVDVACHKADERGCEPTDEGQRMNL